MRLIYISHWRFPSEKTMSPLIMRFCSEMAQRGVSVELWVPNRRNEVYAKTNPYAYHNVPENFALIRLFTLDLVDLLPGALGFFIMVASFNVAVLVRALMRAKEGVFYVHDQRDALLLCLLKRHIIFEIHDFYLSSVDWINRFTFRRASGFVVTNKIKIKVINERYGIPESRMLHMPNAVDVEQFSPNITRTEARKRLSLPEEKRIILYTGHLFDWKGVDTLLEASLLLPDALVYFVGGTGADIADFKEKARRLGAKNVVVAGRKPHAEIPLWQKAADVLVLPNTAKVEVSKYETSPVKLFEYMASGIPIIASDLPSIRNVVDTENVFFFEPDNARSLAETVTFVFEHDEEAKKRAESARQNVQQYSWERRVSSVKDFLESLT